MSSYGERLESAWLAARLSRREFGERMGVSEQAIWAIERGKSDQHRAENAAKAAKVLGCDLYWLCTGEGEAKPAPVAVLMTGESAGAYRLEDVHIHISVGDAFRKIEQSLATVGPADLIALRPLIVAWLNNEDEREELLSAILKLLNDPGPYPDFLKAFDATVGLIEDPAEERAVLKFREAVEMLYQVQIREWRSAMSRQRVNAK